MKLLSYKSTQKGFAGIGNFLIRIRLQSRISHSEIMFEPNDGVDHLMPDGTTEPDVNGAYWCASSTAVERLPHWSKSRANKIGGVRFKRIVPDPAKWHILNTNRNPLRAAYTFKECEGQKYDWKLIFNYVSWLILVFSIDKESRKMCSEICAKALGFSQSWRIDPPTLDVIVMGEEES